MTITMRDGTTTDDRRLGRLVHFDPRSRAFKAVERLAPAEAQAGPRSYSWRLRPRTLGTRSVVNDRWIDQGGEGSCVGHGVVHEAACPPRIVKSLDNSHAVDVYRRAQKIDPWAGEAYEGTSVLAGVKIAASPDLGWYDGYDWCFGEEELWQVVGRKGPVIIGIVWYDSMYRTNKHGYLIPEGRVVGGHCLVVTGQNVRQQDYELLNSWDTFGPCRVSRQHMDYLLRQDGEAVIPRRR